MYFITRKYLRDHPVNTWVEQEDKEGVKPEETLNWTATDIKRLYTKEWCGVNSVHYYNRTILLCILCIRKD